MLSIDFNLIFTVLNILILAFLMKKFLYKPVLAIIEKRQAEADEALDQANKAKSEADKIKSEYEKNLAEAEEESRKTISEAKKTAGDEYKRIVAEAETKAKEIRVAAEDDAVKRKAQIIKSAEKDLADLALNAAAKVVGAQAAEGIDKSLYDEFLNKAGE